MLALLSSSSHCCSGKFHAGLRRGFLGVERELNIECFVTTINTNAIFAIAETMPADDAKRASINTHLGEAHLEAGGAGGRDV